ncbi:hypothetical protein [Streptomyces sp. 6N223]|uniref:hypothetical protein n=1 Tax=Streptomyces sp. 6N223 TaxID=3457412 RepID=UPI003FD5FBB6
MAEDFYTDIIEADTFGEAQAVGPRYGVEIEKKLGPQLPECDDLTPTQENEVVNEVGDLQREAEAHMTELFFDRP